MDSGSDDRELDEEREELFFLVWSMPSWQCSGQLIPDSILRFSSAATGEMPSLNA